MQLDTIISGDCLDIMRQMPIEYMDLLVTDPPYGLSFMGKAWDKALPSLDVWRECLRILKPGAFAFVMCIPRQDCLSRMIINLEDAGFMVNFTPIYHTFATGFPKAGNLSKLADKRAGVEREVVGKKGGRYDYGATEITGSPMGNVDPRHTDWESVGNITVSATPEAKALDGSYAGFQPKPAVEVVIVAMKPLSEKTYLDQALANGHGCTWLDDGRIPYEQDDIWATHIATGLAKDKFFTRGEQSIIEKQPNTSGRFAPNLLCSDDVLNDGRVRESSSGGGQPTVRTNGVTFQLDGLRSILAYGDSGSFSRYFSLDAWAEKNLPESVNRTFPFMIVPKPSKSEKNAGLEEVEPKEKYSDYGLSKRVENGAVTNKRTNRQAKAALNNHPTVKPIKLMSYLIAIGSRPGDVVCDPYAGSGTTGIAAALLDRRYILMELDAEMCDIAERRIAWACIGERQLTLF